MKRLNRMVRDIEKRLLDDGLLEEERDCITGKWETIRDILELADEIFLDELSEY